jgi:UDP-N-acetylmuramyl pentapeptide synthase
MHFVAIQGEKFDGHNYLKEVLAPKENCAIGEKSGQRNLHRRIQYFQVNNSLEAMVLSAVNI